MRRNNQLYIAGHTGLVGSALIRKTVDDNQYTSIVTAGRDYLDLLSQKDVEDFMQKLLPDVSIIIAAAKVGGIHANSTYPADFIYDNIMIQSNLIHAGYKYGVKKLIALGSSCIYPKFCPQPMKEGDLLSGYLEPSNEPYAIAKIAGIRMCQAYNKQYGTNFISLMPTNLYGPNDHYDLNNSHVLPAMIRKIHEAKVSDAKELVLWGTGSPFREFLHVDDLADACMFVMHNVDASEFDLLNIGSGDEISIKDLAIKISEIIDYNGKIVFDTSKPDGTPRKLLDSSMIRSLGWEPRISLEEGIKMTYKSYLQSL